MSWRVVMALGLALAFSACGGDSLPSACKKLATCCVMLPESDQPSCLAYVGTKVSDACTAALTSFETNGVCGGSGTSDGGIAGVTTYCVAGSGASKTCIGYAGLGGTEKDDADEQCTSEQGTVQSSCPTTALDGCCDNVEGSQKTEICFYAGQASTEQSTCVSNATGTWTTTPSF